MHQSLKIPEIVTPICEQLDKRTAFAMALTCRDFVEPALDSIWHTLDTFSPFVYCFPPALWTLSFEKSPSPEVSEPLVVMYLNRPLSPMDLQRYCGFYARRIKVFDIHDAYLGGAQCPMFSAEACLALLSASGGMRGALAPRLLRFKWPPLDTVSQQYPSFDATTLYHPLASLFLSTGAVSVDLSCTSHSGEASHSSATAMVYAIRPLLRLKYLYMPFYTADLDFLNPFVVSAPWEYLEHLTIRRVSRPEVSRLGLLPSLERLDLSLSKEGDLLVPSPGFNGTLDAPSCQPYFQRLRDLRISGQPDAILDTLQIFPLGHRLRELHMDAYMIHETIDESDALKKVLGLVHRRFDLDALRSFIWLETGLNADSDDIPVNVDVTRTMDLSTLFLCKGLRYLHVVCDTPLHISAEVERRIHLIWPRLQSLMLGCNVPRWCPPPIVNHNDLLSILDRLPDLSNLRLSFDVSSVTGLERAEKGPFTLRSMWMETSLPIYSASAVLDFLKGNFTKKADIYFTRSTPSRPCDQCGPDIFRRRWETVMKGWSEHCGERWLGGF